VLKDITDLDVYNESLRLLPKLYELLDRLPISEQDLRIQAKRAAKSVPANLAEGFAKRFYEKEFKRYLMIALASNDEVITHLRILSTVKPKFANHSNILLEDFKTLSKRINTLHKNWRFGGKSSDTPNH
jgi:four helix bundle protein